MVLVITILKRAVLISQT